MRRPVLLLVVCAVGCRPCLQPVTEQNVDSGVESALDGGVFDAGVVDAGVIDAGVIDAGVVDAGVIDAGVIDAGVIDAGVIDAGLLNCPGPTYATAAELARPRRATEWVELALIEATGDFMVGETDYLRAERESSFFAEFRDAGIGLGSIPDYAPDLIVSFDPIGAAAVRAGTYTAWDCLNQTYGGVVSGMGSDWRVVSFRPLNMVTLANDYAQLPHVRYASPNQIGVIASCGYSNDLCVEPDSSGRWTWLAQVDATDCGRTFYRLTTEVDGGRTIEQWDAGEPSPFAWFAQAPQCAMNLWGNPWRYSDGGIVIWTRDGGR